MNKIVNFITKKKKKNHRQFEAIGLWDYYLLIKYYIIYIM